MLSEMEASVPPFIADLDYTIPRDLIRTTEEALVAVAGMDAAAADAPAEMTRFMVRTESVASSKIERVVASTEDFARAIAGSRGNESATSMVAGSQAIGMMIEAAGTRGTIELEDLTAAHAVLMKEDRDEGPYAGQIRNEQNWIGGSDYSPRGALHVPPVPERVEALLADLIVFSNRDDIAALAQAAIAHAQFETIHPFGNGNGRIGRALVGAILRRRGVMRNTIVPVASGLNARRDDYFDALTSYRAGSAAPLVSLMARAAKVGGDEGRISVERIKEMPIDWAERVVARADSTASKIMGSLFSSPVMTLDEAMAVSSTSNSQVYVAMARLEEAEIVTEITGRKRDRVWAATDVMAELDDLDARIRAAMR
ncbi:Fic family protein [Protaetiibacter sp. SSC-01]|nr:Fic family protein [Protaetiibacter sp. SSC-01]